jgi:hypothetical protein
LYRHCPWSNILSSSIVQQQQHLRPSQPIETPIETTIKTVEEKKHTLAMAYRMISVLVLSLVHHHSFFDSINNISSSLASPEYQSEHQSESPVDHPLHTSWYTILDRQLDHQLEHRLDHQLDHQNDNGSLFQPSYSIHDDYYNAA